MSRLTDTFSYPLLSPLRKQFVPPPLEALDFGDGGADVSISEASATHRLSKLIEASTIGCPVSLLLHLLPKLPKSEPSFAKVAFTLDHREDFIPDRLSVEPSKVMKPMSQEREVVNSPELLLAHGGFEAASIFDDEKSFLVLEHSCADLRISRAEGLPQIAGELSRNFGCRLCH